MNFIFDAINSRINKEISIIARNKNVLKQICEILSSVIFQVLFALSITVFDCQQLSQFRIMGRGDDQYRTQAARFSLRDKQLTLLLVITHTNRRYQFDRSDGYNLLLLTFLHLLSYHVITIDSEWQERHVCLA